jgi:glutamate 5-kinase
MSDRAGYLNARNTLLALMELGIICIVNENDVVALDEIEELKFGDNDNLSAMVANLVDADLLILLTDIGGLYTDDPNYNPEAQLIRRVDKIDSKIEHLASKTANRQGTGGMVTKIEAARLATSSGVSVIIADGREPQALIRISNGEEVGTFFPPQTSKMESKKRWLLSGLASKGKVIVDKGAEIAIKEQNKSLLPAGILEVKGDSQRGDILEIFNKQGRQLGCGVSNYSSTDIATIKGAHSDKIASLLGHNYGDEVIHKNNMVVL